MRTVVRSLHFIGAVVEIKWLEYEGDALVERVYVIGNPKWLADLLRTIVTVCGGAVKNGVITRKQLIGLWSQFKCETEPLIQLMGQLDVMVPLEEEGERFLIPCMLPDAVPEGAPLTCEKPQWVFRCSYFMTEGKAVPIGVMGKMIANSLRWGHVVCVWKEGCVVRKDDVCYSVRRQKVPQRDVNGSVAVVDGVHILMSSPESNLSSSHLSFTHFRQSVSNVLSEFYHISHVEVVPLDDECTDWCTLDDVILSIQRKLPMVTSYRGESQRVDALCGDLHVKDMVTNIPSEHIQLHEVLGEGSYGVVRRGEVISNQEVEIEGSGKGKEKEGEAIEVAVKILVDKKEEEGGEGDKRKEIENIISTNWEIYLMGSIHHE